MMRVTGPTGASGLRTAVRVEKMGADAVRQPQAQDSVRFGILNLLKRRGPQTLNFLRPKGPVPTAQEIFHDRMFGETLRKQIEGDAYRTPEQRARGAKAGRGGGGSSSTREYSERCDKRTPEEIEETRNANLREWYREDWERRLKIINGPG